MKKFNVSAEKMDLTDEWEREAKEILNENAPGFL